MKKDTFLQLSFTKHRLTRSYKDGELDAQYCYDPAGNRTKLKTSDTETVYDYNAADELMAANELRYTSDKDGNLISILDTLLEEETRYQYDYAGRLWKVLFPDDDQEIYIYNGDGLRIKRKDKSGTVTNFYWLPGSLPQVLNETDGEGHTTASYILGRGLIGIKTTSGTRYCLTDGLGSVIALTDEDGNITDTYDYDDFGNLTAQTGTSYNPYRYTGQQFDAETGLYYLRARYYDPKLGRFITRDLLKKGNRYVYCGNNPVNYIDFTGLKPYAIVNFCGGYGAAITAGYCNTYIINPNTGDYQLNYNVTFQAALGIKGGGASISGGIYEGPDDLSQVGNFSAIFEAGAAAGVGVIFQGSANDIFYMPDYGQSGAVGELSGVAAYVSGGVSITLSSEKGNIKNLSDSLKKAITRALKPCK